MIHRQLQNGKATGWLLPVVLLLSLFVFSGVSNSVATKHFRAATEQVDHVRVAKKKTVSFKIIGTESVSTADNTADFFQFSITHTYSVNTNLKQCTRHCLGFSVFSPVILHAPRSSTEVFSISSLG